MKKLLNLSCLSAGFVAVLVGYTSSAVIVFQAAAAAGASEAQISSWLWALGIGMGLSSIGLSLRYGSPVLTAWSTPGAALLVTGLSGVSINEAIGVFIFSSLLITFCGLTGWFEKLMQWVPGSLAAAMLAGVLFAFGLNLFQSLQSQLLMVSLMLLVYLLARQIVPRYVIPLALVAGIGVVASQGQLQLGGVQWQLASPVLVSPEFSLSALIGVGIPLFIVTMASQNVPGLAVLRANGYQVPASPLISWTGLTGVLLAPFGGFSFNLAAITAAICMGREADPDPARRYLASVWAGIFYLITGLFGATVVAVFSAFPAELVMAIAGLALLGTIGNSLASALSELENREAALITFLVTASGISLLGVGSAFWGLLLGLIAYHLKARPSTTLAGKTNQASG
ncbi:benzoate/H(+) symporter BenE family transporter [Marinobacterium jannaschii]|uniref:benzoate/H(+) symporter BenE family transporter n=1 Tax=Marinobacterium jannaschii TaxID=64970 RepID=UPI0006862C75|nr:benzoate/H(+) symporter BenE family transporter [Marinobacterium jannaschii]